MSSTHWFVVHTKPRQEHIAVENLQRQGFTTYCPQTVQPKRKRNRWQKVSEPLFPRYLFIQLNRGMDNFAPIRSTLGVVGLVRFGNEPVVMPESVLAAIQNQEMQIEDAAHEYPLWQEGDVLEILEGPFAGLRGIFQKKESMERVSLLLDILGRQHRISVSHDLLARER